MPAPPRRALTALSLVLAVLLTGCASDSSGSTEDAAAAPSAEATPTPEPRALEAGTCWEGTLLSEAMGDDEFDAYVERYAGDDPDRAESLRDDAAFADEVDCQEPHALELYETVELPARLDRRVTEYGDLLDPDTRLQSQVRDAVNQACLADSRYGRSERRAGDLPVQLAPALAEDGGVGLAWDPFPADLWEQGERSFVCTMEQDEPSPLRFSDLATGEAPASVRTCVNIPGRPVPCGRPHQAEQIGDMILNSAVESGDIDAERAVRKGDDGPFVELAEAEYDRLDQVCGRLLRRVSTGRADVEARAFAGDPDQWPTPEGSYLASCVALKPFDPPPKFRGTVFDR